MTASPGVVRVLKKSMRRGSPVTLTPGQRDAFLAATSTLRDWSIVALDRETVTVERQVRPGWRVWRGTRRERMVLPRCQEGTKSTQCRLTVSPFHGGACQYVPHGKLGW